MNEVKWIKLFVDIWDNRKIKQIETLPDGDAVLIIWLKLLTLAGNVNDGGLVYFTPEIPYTDEMLSAQFNKPLQTVKMALDVFQRFGMIEIINNILCVSNWEKYQNIEGMEKVREQTRKRVLKYREKKKNELINIGAKCAYCGEIASGVDHIIPLASGGTDNEENLVPCCLRCNRAKNDKPIVKFLNTHREFINVTSVLNEEKLAQFVAYDAYNDAFYDVTENVTLRNAIEERKKKEDRRKKNNKHIYGEYKHVLLSDEEFEKLKDRFPETYERKIKALDEGIELKGYKYKSHYLAILKWAEKDDKTSADYMGGGGKVAETLEEAREQLFDFSSVEY